MSFAPEHRPEASEIRDSAHQYLQTGHWRVKNSGTAQKPPDSSTTKAAGQATRRTELKVEEEIDENGAEGARAVPLSQKASTAKRGPFHNWKVWALVTTVLGILWWVAAENGCPRCAYCPEMVFVQGGTFQMGSTDGDSDEEPVHTVRVDDFYIGKYEVTQAQWWAVMGDNPSYFSDCDNCPVENVSWNDVQTFIRKLNEKTGKHYRLPTEAEWEYAARVGKNGYKYAGSNDPDEVAWYKSNSGSKTHPVGLKKPNVLGLYDMSGNVWEWCQDWYDAAYYKNYKNGPGNNPQGPSSGSYRVLRGGSWFNLPRYCRVAGRGRSDPSYRYSGGGFRLAQD
ncbi:MAG: hypothetical protein CMN32_12215 [Saprospirales bacterium]|nr:hypothetical protein [Saprospirales bacterium]